MTGLENLHEKGTTDRVTDTHHDYERIGIRPKA